jgi:hypothetical protein
VQDADDDQIQRLERYSDAFVVVVKYQRGGMLWISDIFRG